LLSVVGIQDFLHGGRVFSEEQHILASGSNGYLGTYCSAATWAVKLWIGTGRNKGEQEKLTRMRAGSLRDRWEITQTNPIKTDWH